MEQNRRLILSFAACLAFAAGSCSPSPRLSRSQDRNASRSLNGSEEGRTASPRAAEAKDDQESTMETEAETVLPTPEGAAAPPSPRDARAAARRALVLRAVGTVALFPRASERASATAMEYFDAKRERLVADLKKDGLLEAASKSERALLNTPVGTRPPGKPIQAAEVSEALLIMVWALGPVKRLPEFDATSPGITMLSTAMPEMGAPTADFVRDAQLRPGGEIEHAREKAEIWHWRAQARKRIEEGKFPQGTELDLLVEELDAKARMAGFELGPIRDGRSFFRELIRFSSSYAAKRGLIPSPLQDDFPVKGKSYAELSESEFQRIASIAASRLHALQWIRGEIGDWDAFAEEE